tara:strand:- start:40 stop:1119 length:1080 start_codon:yes stop_codon:yes gene_type:complete
MKRIKVGIVGTGRRMTSTHLPILKELEESFEILGFTSRTGKTSKEFESLSGAKYFDSIDSMLSSFNLDLVVCCVPGGSMYDVIKKVVEKRIPVLTETPVLDNKIIHLSMSSGVPIGVFEQWPRLPLELFKKKVYDLVMIQRPLFVKNDCRSFNYHAMAQLRSYLGKNVMPVSAYGTFNVIKTPAFEDNGGNIKEENEVWDLGIVKFSNGAVLSHEFSYHCKTAPFRSVQTLRAYSSDGTITTGKHLSSGDDFQILDFRCLEGTKTRKMDIKVLKNDNGVPIRIWDDVTNVYWKSDFSNTDLDEHQSSIATIYTDMRDVILRKKLGDCLHTCQDGFLDNLLMSAIQQSAQTNSIVNFGGG